MQAWWSLDVETSGTKPEYALQPWRVKQRKAWITTIAVSMHGGRGDPDEGTSRNAPVRSEGRIYPTRAYIRELLLEAIEKKVRIVGWNIKFDCAWLIAYGCGDLIDKLTWIDGMLLWKHKDIIPTFQGRHSYKLKDGINGAVGAYLPHKVGYEENVDYHSRDPKELARLLAYNIDDTECTLDIAYQIWDSLEPQRQRCALIEAHSIPIVARANFDGMRIDHAATDVLSTTLSEAEALYKAKLEPHGVTEKVIRSPKQLSAIMFDVWGLPEISKRSTAKEVMAELSIVDERIDWLTQYRQALNLQGKFIGGVRKSCEYNGDNRSRPEANIFGTYTSRMTYSSKQGRGKNEHHTGFALHQMKNDPRFRNMVLAPEDCDIVEFDASGQEFRWMAILSGDQVMLNLCAPGEDAHSYMGSRISQGVITYQTLRGWHQADDPRAKKPRKGGKVANLALQYRTSAKTLRIRAKTDHGLDLSKDEASLIWNTYRMSYPGVVDYWNKQIAKGKQLGYAETLAGRRLTVEGDWSGKMKWSLESSMVNYPVQGTGGEQKYLAIKVIKNVLAQYGARFAWDLHDGIYFYVPKAVSMKFAIHVRKLLDNLPYEQAWDFRPPIPLPWDAKIGPSWGALKGVE